MKSKGLISHGGCIPYNPKLKERSRELRKNMTFWEKKLWYQFLQKHKHTFHRQKILDNFIVDFYCSKPQLVIEIDGAEHFTDEGKEYDASRSSIIEGYGLKVIRFTNSEIEDKFEDVCRIIDNEISIRISKPPGPL